MRLSLRPDGSRVTSVLTSGKDLTSNRYNKPAPSHISCTATFFPFFSSGGTMECAPPRNWTRWCRVPILTGLAEGEGKTEKREKKDGKRETRNTAGSGEQSEQSSSEREGCVCVCVWRGSSGCSAHRNADPFRPFISSSHSRQESPTYGAGGMATSGPE